MRKIITVLAVLSLLSSCVVPQSKFDELKSENESIKSENESIKSENKKIQSINLQLNKKIDSLYDEKETIARKELETSLHSEKEALRLIEDYYTFYYANMVYRNPQLRRIGDNKFSVSLQECTNKEVFKGNDFFWHSRVLFLTINNDGTYKVN